MKQLRACDYERYLCVLMEPAARQPQLFALFALNLELSRALEQASEPAMAAVRLKWWQEALVRGDESSHPLLAHLAQCALSPTQVEAFITPHMLLLEAQKGFADMAAFDAYLAACARGLHGLFAQESGEVMMQAGAFEALMHLMRRLPSALSRGHVPLPLDMLRRHGASPAAVEAGLEQAVFDAVMQQLLHEIETRAQALDPVIKTAPKLIRRLHLASSLYMKALKKAGGNPAHLPVRLANLPLRLWLIR